jgi:hypothetical protein
MDTINSETIDGYFSALPRKAPADWEYLPDIGLYMDQLVTYLVRQLELFTKAAGGSLITPSMINNYAKSKIVPRAEGKKYGKEHVALLLTVFTLKRVLSVQDMGSLVGKIALPPRSKSFMGDSGGYGVFGQGDGEPVGTALAEASDDDNTWTRKPCAIWRLISRSTPASGATRPKRFSRLRIPGKPLLIRG